MGKFKKKKKQKQKKTKPPFDESHKGSLKQHLYQGAEKKNYDEYQDSILENRKPEKETTLKVGLNEFRATNDTGYFYATSNKLLTPTNDLQFWVWLAKAISLIH